MWKNKKDRIMKDFRILNHNLQTTSWMNKTHNWVLQQDSKHTSKLDVEWIKHAETVKTTPDLDPFEDM